MITGFKVENDDLVALHNNNGVLTKQNLGRVIGADGHSPYIGANNNWYYWDEFTKTYIDSGVQASGGSKIRIDYMGGNRFLRGSTQLNFNDLYTMHLTGGDFVFVIYNDRAYLCSFINYPSGNALKEMRFESVINADNRTKVSSIYVISNDGVNIANTTVSDINSENSSNKVSEITPANTTPNHYPSTLAVSEFVKPITDEIKDKLGQKEADTHIVDNLIDLDNLDVGRWSVRNGTFDPSQTTYLSTKKQKVLPNELYSGWQIYGGISGEVVEYNAEGAFIKGFGIVSGQNTFTTSADTHYIAFSMPSGYTSRSPIICLGNTQKPYVPYRNEFIEGDFVYSASFDKHVKEISKLNGMTIYNFGDSVSNGAGNVMDGVPTGPAELVAQKCGMTCQDFSVSGSTMSYCDAGGYEQYSVVRRIDHFSTYNPKPDFVLMAGGINDLKYTTVGAFTEPTSAADFSEAYINGLDETKFSGAFEKAIYICHKKWPGTKLVYMFEHAMYGHWNDGTPELYECAKAICKKWSVPFFDMRTQGGFNLAIESDLKLYGDILSSGGVVIDGVHYDGTHCNGAAYNQFYVPKLQAFLENLV